MMTDDVWRTEDGDMADLAKKILLLCGEVACVCRRRDERNPYDVRTYWILSREDGEYLTRTSLERLLKMVTPSIIAGERRG